MTLVLELARATGLDQLQAERVAGTILTALKMSAPREVYRVIEQAIPDTGDLLLKAAPPLGGRTGEMRAFVTELKSEAGVARLTAQLGLQGLTAAQIRTALDTILRYVQDRQGIQAVESLLREMPGLNRLLTQA